MSPEVSDDIVWVPELEMTIEFQGTWRTQVLTTGPFTVMRAQCRDVPLFGEVYALDPAEFKQAKLVGRDLVRSRLSEINTERYEETPRGVDVSARGLEQGVLTEVCASVVRDNDALYVVALSGAPAVMEAESWRVQAMLAAPTYGRHTGHGRGLKGLVSLVGTRISDSKVVMGKSRAQLGVLHNLSKKAHEGPDSAPAPLPSREKKLGTIADRDALADFEARLEELAEVPAEELPQLPVWPEPWQALPNVRPEVQLNRADVPIALSASALRRRRAEQIVSFAQSLPAQVAFHAEKVFGVGASLSHREEEPFSVAGLDALPILLEAMFGVRQGTLSLSEALEMGSPRRSWSELGRSQTLEVSISEALDWMIRRDDATALDLVGWRVGWRQLQQRLPGLGLHQHSIILPARARALAMTKLAGPFEGMDFDARIELWKASDKVRRRELVGALHKAHLATSVEKLGEAFMEMAAAPMSPSRSRWALALSPRGAARQYAGLMAAVARAELFGPAQTQQVVERLGPCVGDHLSGLVPGVDLAMGKLGQTFGALNGVGVLKRLNGGEVAVCVLAKKIETLDREALAQQVQILAAQIYLFVAQG